MPDKYFWDSNLWVYLFTQSQSPDDVKKRSKLQQLLLVIPNIVVSAQMLNEAANVLFRKYNCSVAEVRMHLGQIRLQCEVAFLTDSLTFSALDLKERYQLGWFDSLIAAAALDARCKFLYSEDFQDGLIIESQLTVVNPFLHSVV